MLSLKKGQHCMVTKSIFEEFFFLSLQKYVLQCRKVEEEKEALFIKKVVKVLQSLSQTVGL
jgi:hypothetical protein